MSFFLIGLMEQKWHFRVESKLPVTKSIHVKLNFQVLGNRRQSGLWNKILAARSGFVPCHCLQWTRRSVLRGLGFTVRRIPTVSGLSGWGLYRPPTHSAEICQRPRQARSTQPHQRSEVDLTPPRVHIRITTNRLLAHRYIETFDDITNA